MTCDNTVRVDTLEKSKGKNWVTHGISGIVQIIQAGCFVVGDQVSVELRDPIVEWEELLSEEMLVTSDGVVIIQL